jgi:hypothetical protein
MYSFMTNVGDGEKKTQKKEKGLDFFSKRQRIIVGSGIYIAAKSSCLIQIMAK